MMRLLVIVTMLGLLAPATTVRLAEASEPEYPQLKRWIEFYTAEAAKCDYRLRSPPDARLTVSPKALMSYAHPSGDSDSTGAFYVWTYLGRPELIGSIWSHGLENGRRIVRHEYHSLSVVGLQPARVGSETWHPRTGIELTRIPDVSAPKGAPALRLSQMRSIARDFTGFSTPHGEELRLRTLPQPLYRYESQNPEVLDGAAFGMFAEWDPDIILLVEARVVDGSPAWHYGIGRFNGCPLRLEYKGEEVWKEGLVPLRDPDSNFYATAVGIHRLPPE